jgi:hypothetical protein
MGAPSPELVDFRLVKAINAQDVDAGAATYHSGASVLPGDQVNGPDAVAHGAAGIRETMAVHRALVAGAGARPAKEASHA